MGGFLLDVDLTSSLCSFLSVCHGGRVHLHPHQRALSYFRSSILAGLKRRAGGSDLHRGIYIGSASLERVRWTKGR